MQRGGSCFGNECLYRRVELVLLLEEGRGMPSAHVAAKFCRHDLRCTLVL
jgi:hypothetical protein